jgi:pseudouridine synthase
MAENPKGERLQVALARHGLASRRGVVELIESGKITVNGAVVREKGHRVQPGDVLAVEGRELSLEESREKRTFLFYKPKGVMTTLQDPHAEKTVADYFQDISTRLFPVGRLDRDTTGLLLMTNDGDLAFRLTHPKFGVQKRYAVRVEGVVTPEKAQTIAKGVDLEEGRTAPCYVKIEDASAKETILTVVLHEGKKRQIRRVFDSIGHRVLQLERIQYGPLGLGNLRPGQKRELKPSEIQALERATQAPGSAPKRRG